MTDTGAIADFSAADDSALFKFKQKITSVTGDDSTNNVEIMVPLRCLSNFWRTLEILLTWSGNCMLSNHTKATTFSITDTKLSSCNFINSR